MAIRVLSGNVRINRIYYPKGKVLTGLSNEEEARLIKLGIAERYPDTDESDNLDKSVEGIPATDEVEKPDTKNPESNTDLKIEFNPDDVIKPANKNDKK